MDHMAYVQKLIQRVRECDWSPHGEAMHVNGYAAALMHMGKIDSDQFLAICAESNEACKARQEELRNAERAS